MTAREIQNKVQCPTATLQQNVFAIPRPSRDLGRANPWFPYFTQRRCRSGLAYRPSHLTKKLRRRPVPKGTVRYHRRRAVPDRSHRYPRATPGLRNVTTGTEQHGSFSQWSKGTFRKKGMHAGSRPRGTHSSCPTASSAIPAFTCVRTSLRPSRIRLRKCCPLHPPRHLPLR